MDGFIELKVLEEFVLVTWLGILVPEIKDWSSWSNPSIFILFSVWREPVYASLSFLPELLI